NELLDSYTLNRIAREGVIESEEVESFDLGLRYDYDPSRLKQLNDEQQLALESILERVEEQRYASFLLYGITGSGKTEVYIHALREVLKQGRGGLVLVPEIGLTPQIIRRFYQVFGDQIAVLHSRLSNRERYNAWRALHMGEKRIAIGARSALFAPVPNLGLIVVDEEHDASYKQEDPAPRYHARDAAVMRASFNDAVVVMGSATPSMIALHGARKGKSELLSLGRRPLQAKLPEVHVVDLKQYRSAMKGPLAVPLYDAIGSSLARDEQCILLYNRRGYAYFLQCEECGRIPECPNCSVSLTFHKNRNQLRCHYCGFSTRADEKCNECGGEIRSIGSGTQQLEEQIGDLFPNAETLRMDFDTTSGKNAHDAILSRFGRGEADLLVGTQIVGKGLDFPNVTVVGVIQADTELAFPSFRSGERLFQLLCQVAGRSGRGDKEGVVYFQTWQPDHPAIQAAKEHSYRTFAKRELSYRKSLNYPPFSRIIRFTFKGKQEKRVQQVAAVFTECLTKTGRNLPALGPSPATLKKVQQYYRWETLVKIPTGWRADAIEKLLDGVFESYEKIKPPRTSSVRINVNVDAME
ncbi:MAG: primosomal protein N', partial [Balneolaceae bacterium]|nr:primosomal protein N' [Balneolaceae bacterium]